MTEIQLHQKASLARKLEFTVIEIYQTIDNQLFLTLEIKSGETQIEYHAVPVDQQEILDKLTADQTVLEAQLAEIQQKITEVTGGA